MSHAIAICADYRYLTPAETLIKSIAYHNHNIKIYLLNSDIPQEWFISTNRKLKLINVQVIDTKFPSSTLNNKAVSREYMNQMIYARILIPELISEDRVVYLDSDTIVNGSLKDLFYMDMRDHTIGAVEDFAMPGSFNSGVLLINNNRLKTDPNFTDTLLKQGEQPNSNDDQTLLNEYFKDQWLHLPNQYNYQIGLDFVTFYNHNDNMGHYNSMLKNAKPRLIIHYSTSDKPWNFTSAGRMRDKWWQYNRLDYSEIVNHGFIPAIHRKPKASFLTFTTSEYLSHLEEFLKTFPNYDFNVLAWTPMGESLTTLNKYPNLRLYPTVIWANIDSLISKANAYLDINYGDKEYQFIKRFAEAEKPILGFKDTVGDENSNSLYVFKNNDVEGMKNKIRQIAEGR